VDLARARDHRAGLAPNLAGTASRLLRPDIAAADIPALETLARSAEWRLETGAANLLRLVAASGGKSDEPETSIFNPQNPDYLLKDGCGR